MTLIVWVDYAVVALMGIGIYFFVRKTEAIKIIYGLFVLFLLSILAQTFGLEKTSSVLKKIIEILAMGMVFIFNPEIRMALRKIGEMLNFKKRKEIKYIKELEIVAFSLSKRKIGALIILDEQKTIALQSNNYIEIDSKCTKELIETIFFPNTPLHDGAVIIHQDRIAYAGCKLPLKGKKRKGMGHLGTRHLAALETAEKYNTVAIVVSEETGNVSIATKNGLYRMKNEEMFEEFFRKINEKIKDK